MGVLRIAVEGCAHGALEQIYGTLADIEKAQGYKVDLLICCGDFQSVRNLGDLKCMACPDKYKSMCSFYKFYSGELTAPVLTIFIGGNHEASNYLQELPYGGWVAPKIYYMGYAGVVRVKGVKIGAISGIFKGIDYAKGHFEAPPYDSSTQRSVYHVRNLESFRLKQLKRDPPDIMISHDWPLGIHEHGDTEFLLRRKPFFREDIERNALGSRPAKEILETLKPHYWFSGHLHVKFAAVVRHEDERKVTKFLALDKCLPKRRFLQVVDIPTTTTTSEEDLITLSYDPHWLAILKSTNHLLTVDSRIHYMPGPGYSGGRFDFKPTEEELAEIERIFDGDFKIPENFVKTVEPFNPKLESVRDLRNTRVPSATLNEQTKSFCEKLQIDDPVDIILGSSTKLSESEPKFGLADISTNDQPTFTSFNEDEIVLSDDDEDEDEKKVEEVTKEAKLVLPPPKEGKTEEESKEAEKPKLVLPPPKDEKIEEESKEPEKPKLLLPPPPPKVNLEKVSEIEDECFIVDKKPGSSPPPPKKPMKRRNQAIYNKNDDD